MNAPFLSPISPIFSRSLVASVPSSTPQHRGLLRTSAPVLLAVTHSASLSVPYSESNPIPDPESYAYAVADSDDAGPDLAASVAASHAGVRANIRARARADTRRGDSGRRWCGGSRARARAEAGEHVLSQLQEGKGGGSSSLVSGRSWIPRGAGSRPGRHRLRDQVGIPLTPTVESGGGAKVSPAPCASFATSRRRARRTSDGSSSWGHA